MNKHLNSSHIASFFILSAIIFLSSHVESFAALRFKSEWYFSPTELENAVAGVNEDAIPYFEDHRSGHVSSEYSLSDLQQRAEALSSWLGGMGISSDRAPLTTTPEGTNLGVTHERASAESSMNISGEMADTPQDTLALVDTAEEEVLCEGFFFQDTVGLSLYEFKTDEQIEAEELSECITLDSNTHDFVLLGENFT